MKSKMTAMSYENCPRLKKQKPFSLEEQRANVIPIENDEIGLLDIVIFDAIAQSEAFNR